MRLLLALLFLLATAGPVQAATAYTPEQQAVRELLVARAEAWGADPARVLAVAECESQFTPEAIGRAGERGIAQWLPGRGNGWDLTPAWTQERIDIVTAYRTGDPNAVWFDADMMAWAFAHGLDAHWTCARGGY